MDDRTEPIPPVPHRDWAEHTQQLEPVTDPAPRPRVRRVPGGVPVAVGAAGVLVGTVLAFGFGAATRDDTADAGSTPSSTSAPSSVPSVRSSEEAPPTGSEQAPQPGTRPEPPAGLLDGGPAAGGPEGGPPAPPAPPAGRGANGTTAG